MFLIYDILKIEIFGSKIIKKTIYHGCIYALKIFMLIIIFFLGKIHREVITFMPFCPQKLYALYQ